MTEPKPVKAVFFGEDLSMLLDLAGMDIRSPQEQLRFLVREEAKRRGFSLLPKQNRPTLTGEPASVTDGEGTNVAG